jgi:hypothetical protein
MVVGRPSERQQKLLVKLLRQKCISNVVVTRDRISGGYDGRRLSYPVQDVGCMKGFGNWKRTLEDNTIVVGDDVEPSLRAGVLVHEAVEQYLQSEYGLSSERAHLLATLAQRHYVESIGGNRAGSRD